MKKSDAQQYFAIAAPGLEPLVAAELRAIGAGSGAPGAGTAPVVVPGGVEFSGDARMLYRANLELRVASRVVVRIASFRARTFFELERYAKEIPWPKYIARGSVVTLRVSAAKSKLYHEGAIAERLMQSMEQRVGSIRKAVAARDEEDATPVDEQMFIVRFLRDECVVSADASGALLHLRGYRQAIAKAPLRETLAAALLAGAGWNGNASLFDPMCGSGTIPIEAALLARNIAPGLANAAHTPRAFAFERWPVFEKKAWSEVVDAARANIRASAGVAIVGSDRDEGAVMAATANAERAGVSADVAFERRSVSDAQVPDETSWLVTNPPYGVRVGSGDQRNLFAAIGRLVRERLPHGRIVMLTPDAGVGRHSGIGFSTLFETRNGGIAVRGIVSRPAGPRESATTLP